ncbi:MAG TPA: hypothetical protein VL916_12295 [Ilumatobacteraceae bacterium]|nr:hypothetical protein [Ilumatobacteraceae bacterium]
MNDPFTSLRPPVDRAEPDPHYRAQLLDDVRRHLAGDTRPSSNSITVHKEATPMSPDPDHHRRNVILGIAAAVALIGSLTAIAVARDDDPASPASPDETIATVETLATDQITPTTEAPATTTSTTIPPTTTLPRLTDQEIAEAMLLGSDEYAPGWSATTPADYDLTAVWDPVIAAELPACAPYVESVFGAAANATTDQRFWYHGMPTEAIIGQFVVVFPDDEAASDFFNAMGFVDFSTCARAYEIAAGKQPEGFGYNTGGQAPGGPIGDEFAMGLWYQTWPHPLTGELHGPEAVYSTVMRIGRTVVFTGALHIGDAAPFGDSAGDLEVVTFDQYGEILRRIEDRTRAALA